MAKLTAQEQANLPLGPTSEFDMVPFHILEAVDNEVLLVLPGEEK